MNFQNTEKIETAQFYLNLAIQRAKKKAEQITIRTKNEDKRAELKENTRMQELTETIQKTLARIINNFPGLDGLPEFYYELCKSTFDVDEVKKALSTIAWAPNKIKELERDFQKRIKRKNKKEILNLQKAFIGRVSSIMKRLNKKLEIIEETRKIIQTYPDIKENLYTACIAGFPNVGKSTLLSKITTAKPEIANYAFTTKKLNTGYYREKFEQIQIIDVPGTLDRFEKMNNIEKQAHLAIKYLAHLIIYVYDLTEPYPIEKQEELHKTFKEMGKDVILHFSKQDLLGDRIEKYAKEKKIKEYTTTPQELIKKIAQQKTNN